MELKVEKPEDLFIPPLGELTYLCNGEVTDTRCSSHTIFRDMDFITATPSDIIYAMSLHALIRSKTRGRKRDRWLSYIAKYKISLEPYEFSTIIKSGAFLTIYVDGIDIDEIYGDIVIKNFRVTGTGNFENSLERLLEINPRLVIINKKDFWFIIDAYKVDYLDVNLRKVAEEFTGYKRMECKEIKTVRNSRICFT